MRLSCAATLAVLCVVTGCGTVQTASRLRVVDAASGEPIRDAQGTGVFDMWQPAVPGLLPVHVHFPEEHEDSDSSGLIQFPRAWANFDIVKEGYEPITITSGFLGFTRVGTFDFLRTLPRQADGTVVVPLKPRKHE
jgi:hypothetical protein